MCFNFKPLHYIAFSSEEKKKLVWIRREICNDQALFKSKNSSKQIYQLLSLLLLVN